MNPSSTLHEALLGRPGQPGGLFTSEPGGLFFGSTVVARPIAVSSATFAGSYLCDLIKTAGDPLLCLAFGRKALNMSFMVEISDDNVPSGSLLIPERQHQGQQRWSFFGIRHAAKYAGYGGRRKRKSPPYSN